MYQFNKLVIGGTFDHLHIGHEAFLQKAFSLGRQVIIGLTSDSYTLKKQYSHEILSYFRRKKELIRYLRKEGFLPRSRIIAISDPYGPAISDLSIEAILVTPDTKKTAIRINTSRRKNSLPLLKIVTIAYILGTDKRRIASVRIRLGEEDRFGNVFFSKALALGGRKMPLDLRPILQLPLGKVFTGKNALSKIFRSYHFKKELLITVGDVVTQDALSLKIVPDISIIDFRIGRDKIYRSLAAFSFPKSVHIYRVHNKPGEISKTLFQTVTRVFKILRKTESKSIIIVSGQEDLATIPVILLSPLGSIVLYGQPKKGIVVVNVTEEIKNKIYLLLKGFSK